MYVHMYVRTVWQRAGFSGAYNVYTTTSGCGDTLSVSGVGDKRP